MDYKEWIFEVSQEHSSRATDIATLYLSGLYIEDYSDLEEQVPKMAHCDLIEQELIERDRNTIKIHAYTQDDIDADISTFIEALITAEIPYTITTNEVKNEDYAETYKQYYHPIEIGNFVVVPEWEDIESDKVKLFLDPGMAFGHGGHETTKLCLLALVESVKSGDRVLDIGTGSGILAIGAAKLGCEYVLAVDIDETAVKTANHNVELNGVGDKIDVVCGNLADKAQGKFDVICANIVAAAIINLIPDAVPLLSQDGVFIASGIIEDRLDEVVKTAETHNLKVKEVIKENGWVAIKMMI